MNLKLLAILAALVAVGAFAISNSSADKLKDVQSGVASTFNVHVSVVDAGGEHAAATADYKPASIFSLNFGEPLTFSGNFAIKPLDYVTCAAPLSLTYTGDNPLKVGQTLLRVHVTQSGKPVPAFTDVRLSRNGGAWTDITYSNANSNGDWSASYTAQQGDRVNVASVYQGCGAVSDVFTTGPSQPYQPAPSQPPSQTVTPPPGSKQIAIKVSVSGTLQAKNLRDPITTTFTFDLFTAKAAATDGNAVGKTLTLTTDPTGGEVATQTVSFDNLPVGDVAGTSVVTVRAVTSSTDFTGKAVSESATLQQSISVDGSGYVHITLRPASIVSNVIAMDGTARAVSRTDVPVGTLG